MRLLEFADEPQAVRVDDARKSQSGLARSSIVEGRPQRSEVELRDCTRDDQDRSGAPVLVVVGDYNASAPLSYWIFIIRKTRILF